MDDTLQQRKLRSFTLLTSHLTWCSKLNNIADSDHSKKHLLPTNEGQRRRKDGVYTQSTSYLAILICRLVAEKSTEIAKRDTDGAAVRNTGREH